MNNNNISQITEQQTMTSLEIAEYLNKNHFDVLRAIRKMEPAWEKLTASKFTCCMRTSKLANGVTKENPYFVLTKTECLFVATKFNDEARAKLVLRWEQLEKERLQGLQPHPVPQNETSSTLPADPRNMSRKQLLLMALEAEEENEQLKLENETIKAYSQKVNKENEEIKAYNHKVMMDSLDKAVQIEKLEQQTAYLRVIMSDQTAVTVSQIAQDYGMAAVAFNKLLNGLRIQRRVGEQWILYSDYLNLGYVATRMIPIHHSDGPDTFKPMTTWTQKGRHFLYDRLKKHGVLPVIERQTQEQKGGTA